MRIALVQMTSSDDPPANLAAARDLLREAAARGAGFVLTPEVLNCISSDRAHQARVLATEDADATLQASKKG